jgi:hypothetical protein
VHGDTGRQKVRARHPEKGDCQSVSVRTFLYVFFLSVFFDMAHRRVCHPHPHAKTVGGDVMLQTLLRYYALGRHEERAYSPDWVRFSLYYIQPWWQASKPRSQLPGSVH